MVERIKIFRVEDDRLVGPILSPLTPVEYDAPLVASPVKISLVWQQRAYWSGWHVLETVEDAKVLATAMGLSGHRFVAAPVKCSGLLAEGLQDGVHVEVYRMMQVPSPHLSTLTNVTAVDQGEDWEEDDWDEDDDDWEDEE